MAIRRCVAITPKIVAYLQKRLIGMGKAKMTRLKMQFASSVVEGGMTAQLSKEIFVTIDKIEKNEPVEDRHLLQLAWVLRDIEDKKRKYPIESN